jgi:hypothetical protein
MRSDSMAKIRVNLSIDEDVVMKAKQIGINLSQYCENALKDAIQRLERSYPSRDPDILREPSANDHVKSRVKGGRGTVGSRLEGRRGDLNPTSWLH